MFPWSSSFTLLYSSIPSKLTLPFINVKFFQETRIEQVIISTITQPTIEIFALYIIFYYSILGEHDWREFRSDKSCIIGNTNGKENPGREEVYCHRINWTIRVYERRYTQYTTRFSREAFKTRRRVFILFSILIKDKGATCPVDGYEITKTKKGHRCGRSQVPFYLYSYVLNDSAYGTFRCNCREDFHLVRIQSRGLKLTFTKVKIYKG